MTVHEQAVRDWLKAFPHRPGCCSGMRPTDLEGECDEDVMFACSCDRDERIAAALAFSP